MKPTGTTSPTTVFLLAAFAFGAPGGAVLIVLFWWLLTLVAHPAMADEWWEYALVAAYILSPVWAPLLAGFATLRLASRFGWVDWRNA
jgi:hypothetical protein